MNINDQQLAEISDLAIRQVQLEKEIEDLETTLQSKSESLRNLSENLIPEAMMAVGMESFKLKDGTVVKVDKFYSGSISPDHQVDAFAWLRKTGNDSIIKRDLKLSFGKGEDERAQSAMKIMLAAGYSPVDKQYVHPMTLKSFVREQFETANPDFPGEVFGAFVGNRTKVVPPKK